MGRVSQIRVTISCFGRLDNCRHRKQELSNKCCPIHLIHEWQKWFQFLFDVKSHMIQYHSCCKSMHHFTVYIYVDPLSNGKVLSVAITVGIKNLCVLDPCLVSFMQKYQICIYSSYLGSCWTCLQLCTDVCYMENQHSSCLGWVLFLERSFHQRRMYGAALKVIQLVRRYHTVFTQPEDSRSSTLTYSMFYHF